MAALQNCNLNVLQKTCWQQGTWRNFREEQFCELVILYFEYFVRLANKQYPISRDIYFHRLGIWDVP